MSFSTVKPLHPCFCLQRVSRPQDSHLRVRIRSNPCCPAAGSQTVGLGPGTELHYEALTRLLHTTPLHQCACTGTASGSTHVPLEFHWFPGAVTDTDLYPYRDHGSRIRTWIPLYTLTSRYLNADPTASQTLDFRA
jgi:hypothetical protein